MKNIVAVEVYGVTPVPWTVPTIGNGLRKDGTRFRFMTRERKSRPNDGTPSLETWQGLIREEAERKMDGTPPCEGPVHLHVALFDRTPPGKRDGQVWFPGVKQNAAGDWVRCGRNEPDLTNLVKGVEDALNGVAYRDDIQVRQHYTTMWYHDCPGVLIIVAELEMSDHPGTGNIVPEYEAPERVRKRRANK